MSIDMERPAGQALTEAERSAFKVAIFLRLLYLSFLVILHIPLWVKLVLLGLWVTRVVQDFRQRKKTAQEVLKPISPWWILVFVVYFGVVLWFCVIRDKLH
jgi:hypothetical protein